MVATEPVNYVWVSDDLNTQWYERRWSSDRPSMWRSVDDQRSESTDQPYEETHPENPSHADNEENLSSWWTRQQGANGAHAWSDSQWETWEGPNQGSSSSTGSWVPVWNSIDQSEASVSTGAISARCEELWTAWDETSHLALLATRGNAIDKAMDPSSPRYMERGCEPSTRTHSADTEHDTPLAEFGRPVEAVQSLGFDTACDHLAEKNGVLVTPDGLPLGCCMNNGVVEVQWDVVFFLPNATDYYDLPRLLAKVHFDSRNEVLVELNPDAPNWSEVKVADAAALANSTKRLIAANYVNTTNSYTIIPGEAKSRWADLADDDEDTQNLNWKELHDQVAAASLDAPELLHAGCSNAPLKTICDSLKFPCAGAECRDPPDGQEPKEFPATHLMPVTIGHTTCDLCYQHWIATVALQATIGGKVMSFGNFKYMVWKKRKSQLHRFAVTDTHSPQGDNNMIFEAFRELEHSLKHAPNPTELRYLRRLGRSGYIKMIKTMMKDAPVENMELVPGAIILKMNGTVSDLANMHAACAKAWGEDILSVTIKASEFPRMIMGNDKSPIAIAGGFICWDNQELPEEPFGFSYGTGCNTLSGWFCGLCGLDYPHKEWGVKGEPGYRPEMPGFVSVSDKITPEQSFAAGIKMPTGKRANWRAMFVIFNAIRSRTLQYSVNDLTNYSNLAQALRRWFCADARQLYACFPRMSSARHPARYKRPNLRNQPHNALKLCSGPDQLTLREEEFGRSTVAIDLREVFGEGQTDYSSDAGWDEIFNMMLDAMSVAELCAIDPTALNAAASIAMADVIKLKNYLSIRLTGKWCLTSKGKPTSEEASEQDRSDASLPFRFG